MQVFIFLSTLFIFTLPLKAQQHIQVEGEMLENLDMSAISCSDDFCLLASDETNVLQIGFLNNGSLTISKKLIVLGKYKKENDIEGLSFDGKYFYAIGSHGLSRKSGKYQASRYVFFRILLDKAGNVLELKKKSLNQHFEKSALLKPFYKKKLQENGINIEGLAYNQGKVFIGYRAPLIKGKALIESFDASAFFENDEMRNLENYQVDLNGQGIRSIEFKENDLYLISGNSKPLDNNLASLWKINLVSHLKVQLFTETSKQVPFQYLKLEGMELLWNKIIYMYDSEPFGNLILTDY